MFLPILDALTSVFSGFVIFVYLGYMAHLQDTTVENVVKQGSISSLLPNFGNISYINFSKSLQTSKYY